MYSIYLAFPSILIDTYWLCERSTHKSQKYLVWPLLCALLEFLTIEFYIVQPCQLPPKLLSLRLSEDCLTCTQEKNRLMFINFPYKYWWRYLNGVSCQTENPSSKQNTQYRWRYSLLTFEAKSTLPLKDFCRLQIEELKFQECGKK